MLAAVIVFLGVFLAVLLLLSLVGSESSREAKQTLARLDSLAGRGVRGAQDETFDIRRHELLSGMPWFNRWLHGIEISRQLRLVIQQADVSWTVGRLVLLCLFLALAAGYLVEKRTGADLLALLLGVGAGSLPLVYVLRKRAQRFARFELLLPEAVDLMVGAIRAGHSFSSAMGLVSKECGEPVRSEFRKCYDEQNFGLELRSALENFLERMPVPDLRMIVTAVLIQQESGGNITEILAKVAELIRERFRLQRQIRVHTAQGRITGLILALLPVVLGVLIYLIRPEHMSLLWKREIGIKMLYAGVTMQVIGMLIIRKIVRMKV